MAGRLLVLGLWFRFRDDRGARASGRSWRGEGIEEQAQKPLLWAGGRQREGDPGLLFDDGGRELDEMQAERVELGAAPRGFSWTGGAQFPPHPVSGTVQHQPHLVGVRL